MFSKKQLDALKDKGMIRGYSEAVDRDLEPQRSKYGNKKVEVDGILFDSKKEANRYFQLKQRKATGEIFNLYLQVEFQLSVCTYVADFTYQLASTEKLCVEDVKSPATRKLPVYRLKKKMMMMEKGIEVLEV